MECADDYIHSSNEPEIILLQEIGSTSSLSNTQSGDFSTDAHGIREVGLGAEHDLHHFRVFCGSNDSHLAQVIAVDADVLDNVRFQHCGEIHCGGLQLCRDWSRYTRHFCSFPHSGYGQDEVEVIGIVNLLTTAMICSLFRSPCSVLTLPCGAHLLW